MTGDQTIRLVGALVWPALLLLVVVLFHRQLSDFLGNLGELSVKAFGVEASARRREVEAAVAVGAATALRGGRVDPAELANSLAQAVPDGRAQRRLQGRLVLWVDDQAENNWYERRAMEALGVRFVLSPSTEDALGLLRRQSFDLIISDMDRPPDDRAGYTLLDQLREDGDETPFVIYRGFDRPEDDREARRRGALGSTASPDELIRIVTRALGAAPA
jgi:CheY-like chemotaxis protein